jgi:hypothetical protein
VHLHHSNSNITNYKQITTTTDKLWNNKLKMMRNNLVCLYRYVNIALYIYIYIYTIYSVCNIVIVKVQGKQWLLIV